MDLEYSHIIMVGGVELNPTRDRIHFLKDSLNVFCMHNFFFLHYFFLYLILYNGIDNRNKTRPRRPQIHF